MYTLSHTPGKREREAGGDLHGAKFYPKENKKEWTWRWRLQQAYALQLMYE